MHLSSTVGIVTCSIAEGQLLTVFFYFSFVFGLPVLPRRTGLARLSPIPSPHSAFTALGQLQAEVKEPQAAGCLPR